MEPSEIVPVPGTRIPETGKTNKRTGSASMHMCIRSPGFFDCGRTASILEHFRPLGSGVICLQYPDNMKQPCVVMTPYLGCGRYRYAVLYALESKLRSYCKSVSGLLHSSCSTKGLTEESCVSPVEIERKLDRSCTGDRATSQAGVSRSLLLGEIFQLDWDAAVHGLACVS